MLQLRGHVKWKLVSLQIDEGSADAGASIKTDDGQAGRVERRGSQFSFETKELRRAREIDRHDAKHRERDFFHALIPFDA